MRDMLKQGLGAAAERFEQFRVDPRDFVSAREPGETAGTQIDQQDSPLEDASEVVNKSVPRQSDSGYTNVISPVVLPRRHRRYLWLVVVATLLAMGLVGRLAAGLVDVALASELSAALFGPHYWLVLLAYVAYNLWRNSFVMVPDGCQALITRFGKLEAVVGPGRTWLLNPWKRVSYIVNTTKEYPYNAPIRQAPTSVRVNASVDLFLQFRIEDPAEFIFTLGAVKGFSEKLHNAISEVTRALIYEQKAEDIYDLVGESTQPLLGTLNRQFLPAVRFVSANITHAEPSSLEYRMDLASPEMVRVAKEAYTYEYELKLRKEQDEGELSKELASLRELLSGIRAEIATYQAQIDTAREKETHRANAYARQRLIEVESEAKANAALLEAQALDLRALSYAASPQILEYRFQQDSLSKLEAVAGSLPQVVDLSGEPEEALDYMGLARRMLGLGDQPLFSREDMQALRLRVAEIQARVDERSGRLHELVEQEQLPPRQEEAQP
jgi:regulator of protease activity HflC (stomatin/prohibitin superfamily)